MSKNVFRLIREKFCVVLCIIQTVKICFKLSYNFFFRYWPWRPKTTKTKFLCSYIRNAHTVTRCIHPSHIQHPKLPHPSPPRPRRPALGRVVTLRPAAAKRPSGAAYWSPAGRAGYCSPGPSAPNVASAAPVASQPRHFTWQVRRDNGSGRWANMRRTPTVASGRLLSPRHSPPEGRLNIGGNMPEAMVRMNLRVTRSIGIDNVISQSHWCECPTGDRCKYFRWFLSVARLTLIWFVEVSYKSMLLLWFGPVSWVWHYTYWATYTEKGL